MYNHSKIGPACRRILFFRNTEHYNDCVIVGFRITSVNVNDVLDALKDIKLGKHDGNYSLTSDHVVNSSRRVLVILSILMSSMLVHGYNAADLLSSTIISIPKDARGDMSRSDNYRGIALFASSLILYL